MDNSKLITIVVTAVITAIAKELVTWLLSLPKALSTSSTLKTKVRQILNRYNRAVFWDMGFVIMPTMGLIHALRDKSPVTRFDILFMILCVGTILLGLLMLLIDTVRYKYHIKHSKENITSPPRHS